MRVMTDHALHCDILVAGGGAAGVPCALAAARCGATVILVQDRPVLGGNASSEIRMHTVGANAFGQHDRGAALKTEAREGGIVEEMRLENAVRNPQRSASMHDLILFEMCHAETNLTLLLNTCVTGVEMEGEIIANGIAERQSTEDRFSISAKIFIDCTGDGRLGVEAGSPYMEGREDKQAFGESLAQEIADDKRLGSSMILQARHHQLPMPFKAPAWARRFSQEDLRLRLYTRPGDEQPTHEYGYWWAEYGGIQDTIKDNEPIRDEMLAILLGIWDHVKNGPPGTPESEDPLDASHWALDWFGFVPGKRESRRFVGQYVLTQNDIQGSTAFEDAIAYGGWPLDLHPPEGIDAPSLEPCVQYLVPYLYDIPLRACVSNTIFNLMFAGRNISATHVALASTRVMATCAVMGQGVGTAAAIAVQQGELPSDLATTPKVLKTIQQRLLRDDCYLIGQVNGDVNDLAKQARITASSEGKDGAAAQVAQGQSRCVHGDKGAPLARRWEKSQRWMSDRSEPLPAILELEWDSPVNLREVQLVFDTGQHRHLTLSHHDGYIASMLWGQAQPETVRDYALSVYDGASWNTLLEVEGNYQRNRIHHFAAQTLLHKLRITVTATNGLDHARILEVRAYA